MHTISLETQGAMSDAFRYQLLKRMECSDDSELQSPLMVGVETEYLVVDQHGNLAEGTVRDQIVRELPGSSVELGASVLETHTAPVPICGTQRNLLQEALQTEAKAVQVAQRFGYCLVRLGSYPGSFRNIATSRSPDRYQRQIDLLHSLYPEGSRRKAGFLTLPLQPCGIMGGCQSTQLNIQVPTGQVAIDLLNKTFELTPYLIAISTNSSIMDGSFTGFQEFRIPLWKALYSFPHIDLSFGISTDRVGLPRRYYESWSDYWDDVGEKLFMTDQPEEAFDANVKMFWRIARLKPCPELTTDCLLEARAFSVQPSVVEDVALHYLLCALLEDAASRPSPLLPIHMVEYNLQQASKYGLDARLYARAGGGSIIKMPARLVISGLLDQAISTQREKSREAVELISALRGRLSPFIGTPAVRNLQLYHRQLRSGLTVEEATRCVLLANCA